LTWPITSSNLAKWGYPTSAESFDLLQKKQVIDRALSEKMKKMVQFRNVAIHQYKTLDIEIVKSVITRDIDDLVTFADKIMEFAGGAA
jgi:uncharacterized protein YutE (UPF0331/DUF86 family)